MPGPITRGLGTTLLVTRGYGFPPQFVPDLITDVIHRKGGGGASKRRQQEELLRELEPIVVWAKLIEINDVVHNVKIEGQISLNTNKINSNPTTTIKLIKHRVRSITENIKIRISRLRPKRK